LYECNEKRLTCFTQLHAAIRTIRNNTRAKIRAKLLQLLKISKDQSDALTEHQRKELFDKHKIDTQLEDISRSAFKCLEGAKLPNGILDFTRQTVSNYVVYRRYFCFTHQLAGELLVCKSRNQRSRLRETRRGNGWQERRLKAAGIHGLNESG
jgi:hypothetical protein